MKRPKAHHLYIIIVLFQCKCDNLLKSVEQKIQTILGTKTTNSVRSAIIQLVMYKF